MMRAKKPLDDSRLDRGVVSPGTPVRLIDVARRGVVRRRLPSQGAFGTPSADASAALHWHVLHCKPGRDACVAQQIADGRTLSGRQLPPGYRVWIVRGWVETTRREEVLFPGYVLVGFACEAGLAAPLWYVDHVVRLISTADNRPLPLPAWVIAQLLAPREAPPPRPGHRFAIDAQVRAVDGPFIAFVGRISALPAHDRVVALMSIFGRESRVEMATDMVEAV